MSGIVPMPETSYNLDGGGASVRVVRYIRFRSQVFNIFGFQLPPGLPVWKLRKNPLKACVSRKGALCKGLAGFRCEGCTTPFSLLCALAHNSLVVRREILLDVNIAYPI